MEVISEETADPIFRGFGPSILAQQTRGRLQRLALPCLLYTSPSPRDRTRSRMPSSA